MSTTHVPLERVQTDREDRRSSRRRLLGAAAASALAFGGLKLPKAQLVAAQRVEAQAVRTYANGGNIEILDQRTAVPYPSTIRVRGMPGSIIDNSGVKVRLRGLSHSKVHDVQMALESPVGTTVWLMGSVGSDTPGSETSVANLNLLIFDGAPGPFPATSFNSGSYRPTRYDATMDTRFPGPARSPITSTSLGDNAGASPNGIWKLYIFDSGRLGAGNIINGWTLNFTTTNSPPIVRPNNYQVKAGRTRVIRRPGVLGNDRDPDGDRLTVVPFERNSPLGRISVKRDGSLRFEAREDVRGVVRFAYTVEDTAGAVRQGRIRIRVRP